MLLRKELNQISAKCHLKAELLSRLQVQASPPPPETLQALPDFAMLFMPPSARISELQQAIEAAKARIISEDQRTEELQSMLKTVTEASTIMRQRTTETQSVLIRVSRQLHLVTRLHTVAANSYVLTSDSANRCRDSMAAAKEQILDRISRKQSDKVVIDRTCKKAVERIGTAEFNKAEASRKRQAFKEAVEAAALRHAGEKQKKAQTARIIEQYRSGFQAIAELLACKGCMFTYSTAAPAESVHLLLTQLNGFAMREASLSSLHSNLAMERSEKERELRRLRGVLSGMVSAEQEQGNTVETEVGVKVQGVEDHSEQLCIQLHASVLSLLSQYSHFDASPVLPASETPSPSLPSPALFSSRKLSRSHTLTPSTKPTAELWHAPFHTSLNMMEIQMIAREMGVGLGEKETEEIEWLLGRSLIAKYFATTTAVRDFLGQIPKFGFEAGKLLEECHFELQTGFKAVIDKAIEVTQLSKPRTKDKASHLSRTSSVRSENLRSPDSLNRLDKPYSRLRLPLLPDQPEEFSLTESPLLAPTHSDSKPPKSAENGSKPGSTLSISDESEETQHMLRMRTEVKSRMSTAATTKRPLPLIETRLRRIHEMDAPPTTERAQTLLRGYLDTERRIAAVRDAERVSLKTHSSRLTPTAFHTRTTTAASSRRHHRSTLSLGSLKGILHF